MRPKHRNDHNHGKNGFVGGNPRYNRAKEKMKTKQEHEIDECSRLLDGLSRRADLACSLWKTDREKSKKMFDDLSRHSHALSIRFERLAEQ